MFYSQVILARKGPLGKIWLAAHFDKKLTKNQIFTTDISESVDSVLNPPAPLALRVSGHLMLGIVRIYSRKVKYLMADCTEAMWKIKLAFRPGNVDLADAQSATVAIDDPRFFGNIMPDQDYPDLEDIAFSQNMLSNFVSLQAARGRTIASQQDTTQDENDYRGMNINESPMINRKNRQNRENRETTPLSERDMNRSSNLLDMGHIPGEENWKGRDSVSSRISNIEMVRGESRAGRSVSGDRDRASLSTLRSSLSTGGGLAMRFDDDIPAFDDHIEDFGGDEAPPLNYFNEYAEEPMPEMDTMDNVGDMGGVEGIDGDMGARGDGDERGDIGAGEYDDVNQPEGEYRAGSPAVESPNRARKVRSKKTVQKRGKRQRVAVDESVELSSRAIKLRMADMAPILRRRPGDPLPRMTKTSSSSSGGGGGYGLLALRNSVPVPPGARGLCPELQSLFAMTMVPSNRLPFPRRAALLAANRERDLSIGGRSGGMGSGGREGRESLSIENVRDGSVQGSDTKSRRVSTLTAHEDEEGEKDRFSPLAVHDFGDEDAFNPNDDDRNQDYNDQLDNMGDNFADNNLGNDNIGGEGGDNYGGEGGDSYGGDGGDNYGGGGDGGDTYGESKYGLEDDTGPGALKSREEDFNKGKRRGRESGNDDGVERKDDFSVRTAMVRDVLKDQLKESETVSFSSISKGISRRTAAACFLEVLQLKTWGYIDCVQERPFADIGISATDKLWAGDAQLIQT